MCVSCVYVYKQSQRKVMQIYDRVVPLDVFFRLHTDGSNVNQTTESVNKGSTFYSVTIKRWARIVVQNNFRFPRFRMGTNRSVLNLMWDFSSSIFQFENNNFRIIIPITDLNFF